MKTTIYEEDGKMIAAFEGRLDTAAAVLCAQDVEPLNNTDKDIVLECSNLSYISSSGLRIFLNILKNAKAKSSHVYIRNVSEDILSVLSITGFTNIFDFI